MNGLRDLFPVATEWAYLNHCGVAPLAAPVTTAMQGFLVDQQRNGNAYEAGWRSATEATRQKAAAVINAGADEIAFLRNTVEGVSLVAEGLDWRDGDNVVTVNGEYPANVYPWLNLKTRGVETRMAPDHAGRVVLDEVFAATDNRTRLIALSFVEFVNGFRNDVVAAGEFCRRRGILFLVDAIQGLGVLPIDVRHAQIDFLAAGAHKWLLGPLGIGIFFCRRAVLENLRPVQAGPFSMIPRSEYLPYEFVFRPDARRFEPGAQNFAGIYGLGASLEILAEAGVTRIESHVRSLLDFAVAGLQSKGCEILSSLKHDERSGIIAFRSQHMATPDLVTRLRSAKVVVTARSGGIRVAPHLYNNSEDIARLLAEVPDGAGRHA